LDQLRDLVVMLVGNEELSVLGYSISLEGWVKPAIPDEAVHGTGWRVPQDDERISGYGRVLVG
jgi:hypothetical protein